MRTILISPDQSLNAELAAALLQFPEIDLVRQITEYPEPEELLRVIRVRRPDVLFVSVSDFPRFEALVRAVDEGMPGLPVIGVGRDEDPLRLIPKLMHLGIREFVSSPVTQEKLKEVIASTEAQLSRHPAPLVRLAELNAFLPAKAGVGASTIAISTSCALADELGVRTILLDCDLAAGVTKFLLKLGTGASIVNAMDQAASLDEDLWSQMVAKRDGLDILHAGELDPPTSLTASSLDRVLSLARSQYQTICADLASSLDPFSIQIMREARRILLVTTAEIVPLHMAASRLRHLNELGLADKVSLLLNRRNGLRFGLPDNEVVSLVGLPIAHRFSNDYPLVQSAILGGTSVSNRTSLGQSIMDLARSLAPNGTQRGPAPAHRKFLEFFHVPSSRDHETMWND